MDNKAFTLAEVLITLGIIGVVAALTLPAVKNKAEQYIRKQQLKKVYSALSNALSRSFTENGGFYYECYYEEKTGTTGECLKYDAYGTCIQWEGSYGYNKGSECSALFQLWQKYFKVIRVCEKNALAKGCVPADMKGTDTLLIDPDSDMPEDKVDGMVSSCANLKEANIKNNNTAWVLGDGTIIGFYGSTNMSQFFWVDINGHKKPNKWGHDIFAFKLVGDGKYVTVQPTTLNPTCAMPVEKGGMSAAEMLFGNK